MNRRKFLTIAGASALAAPLLVKQAVKHFTGAVPPPDLAHKALALAFAPDEKKVLGVLQARSQNVCLLGGGVMAKAQRQDLPYANLLVESDQFTQIKGDLFQLGVEPVSTPELPGSVIRFNYQDRPYSVANLSLDQFLQQNVVGAEHAPLPFAHNFLVYSVDGGWVIDPYAALGKTGDAKAPHAIELLQSPASPVVGLTCALSAVFDAALLALKESPACERLTRKSLDSTVAGKDAHLVMEQVINYVPDLLESCGFDVMQRFLVAPLSLSGGQAAGIDLQRVSAALKSMKRRGVAVDGTHLMGAMNHEFLRKKRLDGIGLGLSDYMATQGFMVRRTDLLTASLKLRETELIAA